MHYEPEVAQQSQGQLSQFQALLDSFGMRLRNPHFFNSGTLENLSPSDLAKVCHGLGSFIDSLTELQGQEYGRDFELRMLDAFLKPKGWRLADGGADLIESGDIIEIYDQNLLQRYRNLVFMEFCSYDLVTLLTHDFFDLYSIPESAGQMIQRRVQEMHEPGRSLEPSGLPAYLLKEIHGERHSVFKIQIKYFIPILDEEDNTVALVVTNRCEPFRIQQVKPPEPRLHS